MVRNKRAAIIAAVAGALALATVGYMALNAYAGSDDAKSSLLVNYFRALSSADKSAVAEFTVDTFVSDLGFDSVERGSYELYDFGEPAEGVVRFMIVYQGATGPKRAMLGDMAYRRIGIANRIESIKRIEEGTRLKE